MTRYLTLKSNFKNVDILKSKLDKRRPLDPAALKNLREVYRIEWTYNSNAIEGNTLSLLETKLVVEEGLTIGGKRSSCTSIQSDIPL